VIDLFAFLDGLNAIFVFLILALSQNVPQKTKAGKVTMLQEITQQLHLIQTHLTEQLLCTASASSVAFSL
jgi:hypothetical protein